MHIEWLKNVGIQDINLVGGKNASLGEMLKNLSSKGINVPNGFVVTTDGYLEFLAFNNLDKRINDKLAEIKDDDLVSLRRTGLEIRLMIQNGDFPSDLENDIINTYAELSMQYVDSFDNTQLATDVAGRSSSTAED